MNFKKKLDEEIEQLIKCMTDNFNLKQKLYHNNIDKVNAKNVKKELVYHPNIKQNIVIDFTKVFKTYF